MRLLTFFLFSIVASGQSLHPPTLLTQGGTSRAIAVEASTYRIEPFTSNRIILFANLSDSLELSASGELNGTTYPFTVEHVEPVPECPGTSYVFLKAPELPTDPGDLRLWITSHGMASNRVRVAFGHVGGGSPDADCRPTFVVFDGNSLTRGESASSFEFFYPTQTMNQIGCAWEFVNVGTNSITTVTMQERAPGEIDPLIKADATNILVGWEVTNDLYFGASAEEAYQHFVSYCQARRMAGWKVVALTVLPRSAGPVPADFETTRGNINARIRSNYLQFADGLADVASDGRLSNPGNARYFADRVHLTDDGYGIVAETVMRAITAFQ